MREEIHDMINRCLIVIEEVGQVLQENCGLTN
jgi:hypothetical protein